MAALSFFGSKITIGPLIKEAIVEYFGTGALKGATLVDAFFGAGGFSITTHDLFDRIIANDLELFSKAIGHALFCNPLQYTVTPQEGYITRTYCTDRSYWTEENGNIIDAHRNYLKSQPESRARWASLGLLISAADKRANVASQYGAFLKKRKATAIPDIEIKPIKLDFTGRFEFSLGSATIACLNAPEGSLIYLDPPYTKRPYGNNYFPLNVICNLDEDPDVAGVTGIPTTGWNRSKWNNRDEAHAELCTILKNTKATMVVMSYSTDALMHHLDIMKAFQANGWAVEMKKLDQRRFKSHDIGVQNEAELKELLFLASRPPPPLT